MCQRSPVPPTQDSGAQRNPLGRSVPAAARWIRSRLTKSGVRPHFCRVDQNSRHNPNSTTRCRSLSRSVFSRSHSLPVESTAYTRLSLCRRTSSSFVYSTVNSFSRNILGNVCARAAYIPESPSCWKNSFVINTERRPWFVIETIKCVASFFSTAALKVSGRPMGGGSTRYPIIALNRTSARSLRSRTTFQMIDRVASNAPQTARKSVKSILACIPRLGSDRQSLQRRLPLIPPGLGFKDHEGIRLIPRRPRVLVSILHFRIARLTRGDWGPASNTGACPAPW